MYWLYWYYRVNDDIRMYLRNYSIRPLISTLAIVGLFLAVPLIVVTVLTEVWWLLAIAALLDPHGARRVLPHRQAGGHRAGAGGRRALVGGTRACCCTWRAGFFGGSYLQAGLNRVWERSGG